MYKYSKSFVLTIPINLLNSNISNISADQYNYKMLFYKTIYRFLISYIKN